MTFMGFVHNYEGLMAARWFLGLAEAGLFPGINYYLSCWYRRSEFGIRAVSKPYPRIEFLIDVCVLTLNCIGSVLLSRRHQR